MWTINESAELTQGAVRGMDTLRALTLFYKQAFGQIFLDDFIFSSTADIFAFRFGRLVSLNLYECILTLKIIELNFFPI